MFLLFWKVLYVELLCILFMRFYFEFVLKDVLFRKSNPTTTLKYQSHSFESTLEILQFSFLIAFRGSDFSELYAGWWGIFWKRLIFKLIPRKIHSLNFFVSHFTGYPRKQENIEQLNHVLWKFYDDFQKMYMFSMTIFLGNQEFSWKQKSKHLIRDKLMKKTG